MDLTVFFQMLAGLWKRMLVWIPAPALDLEVEDDGREVMCVLTPGGHGARCCDRMLSVQVFLAIYRTLLY